MSWLLVAEALDRAPAHLSAGDRLVLVVLAEQARTETRECWPGAELLNRRAGMTDRSVRRALSNLVEAGVIERVPVTVRPDGTAVYAHPGQRARFRILPLPMSGDEPAVETTNDPPGMADADVRQLSTVADTSDPHSGENGGRLGPEWRTPRTEWRSHTSALPSVPSGNRHTTARAPAEPAAADEPVAAVIRRRLACSPDEAAAAAVEIRARPNVEHPAGYAGSMPLAALRRLVPVPCKAEPGALPPPCGQCDARPEDQGTATRQITGPDGALQGLCPRCNPRYVRKEHARAT